MLQLLMSDGLQRVYCMTETLSSRWARSEAGLSPSRFLLYLSNLYKWLVVARVRLYEIGCFRQHRLPCPVISVGNITVGGTGKTPLVMWLAQWLQRQGYRVGVLSRGYRRKGRASRILVSDGQRLLTGPEEAGDEPYLMAQRLPGVVVAVGTKRHAVGQWVLRSFPVDCFILDDGFQHLSLAREANILLIDATDSNGLDGLLPAGRLREPLAEAVRATHLVMTRVTDSLHLAPVITKLECETKQRIMPGLTNVRVSAFKHLASKKTEHAECFTGKRAFLFSGIGNAQAFRRTVQELDIEVVGELVYPDHYAYTEADLATIQRRASEHAIDVILTTEKDAVKLERRDAPASIWAVCVDVYWISGEKEFTASLTRLMGERHG